MDLLNAIVLGVALAACAGLRVFLPIFAAALIARLSGWEDTPVLAWATTDTGLIVLGVATVAEWIADKVPLLDNLLDAVQVFIKPVAGVLVALGAVYHLSPEAAWVLAFVGGAPVALATHSAKASVRAGSTGFTAGIANPFLSFLEDVAAVVLIVLAIVVPIVALLVLLFVLFRLITWWTRRRERTA